MAPPAPVIEALERLTARIELLEARIAELVAARAVAPVTGEMPPIGARVVVNLGTGGLWCGTVTAHAGDRAKVEAGKVGEVLARLDQLAPVPETWR